MRNYAAIFTGADVAHIAAVVEHLRFRMVRAHYATQDIFLGAP